MGKYMENESLDIMVSAIVDKALQEYKKLESRLKEIKSDIESGKCLFV